MKPLFNIGKGWIWAAFLASPSLASEIKPFTSDGCSAFPDGTAKQNTLWLACCTAHDLAYWQGGTYRQRLQADMDLHQCVHAIGEQEIAILMLAGVRVGGSPYFPTKFRWAYGWPYTRGYKALTPEDVKQIENVIATPNHNSQVAPTQKSP